MLLCFSPALCQCCHHCSLSCHSRLLSPLPPSCDWLHTPHCPQPSLLNVQLLYSVHNAAHLSSVHSEGRTLTFAAPDPGPCPDHPPSSLSPLSSSRPPQSSASRDLVSLSLCMNKSRVSWPTALLSALSWWLTTHQARTRRVSQHQYNWVLT